jgi:hypothetical protein
MLRSGIGRLGGLNSFDARDATSEQLLTLFFLCEMPNAEIVD